MWSSLRFLAVVGHFLQSVHGFPTPDEHGHGHGPGHGPGHSMSPTLYFLENQMSGNHIVAVAVPEHGSGAVNYTRTSTGGMGQRGISGNMTAGPDGMFGQGSVVVSGNLLFTVNPGSKTLAMFGINPWDPMHPIMIGSPASTLGDFPMSVDYSPELRTACVLNGGMVAGVTCFSVDYRYGLKALDKSPRPLPEAFMQSTPPSGPPETTSQISFSPDNTYLMATIKGNFAAMPPTPGWISVWPINSGKVSTTATVTSLDTDLAPFGFGFFSPNTIIISDPTHGGSVLSVASDLTISSLATLKLTNFTAACWAISTPDLKTGYIIDAGSTQVAVIDAASNSITSIMMLPPKATSGFDAVTDGKSLYVLAGTANIAVVDLMHGNAESLLDLTHLGHRPSWQGLAMYQSWRHGW